MTGHPSPNPTSTMTNNIRVTAKKSLGQNFLVNPHILNRIVAAADVSSGDSVLEVGPGTGALTEHLANTGASIIAVEKDRRLIEPLREKFSASQNIRIIEGDILTLAPEELSLKVRGYKIVANIPYYLTSHLIRLALERWPSPSVIVLMVQEEVARRMMASPPDMNLLALSVQLYAEPTLIARVSRNSFRPVPNVDSAVVRLIPSGDTADTDTHQRILAIAKKAFGQKRKQLKATVPVEALEKAGIPVSARPQELSLDQWRLVAQALL